MNAPELGDIFRIHGPAYFEAFGDSLSGGQRKAVSDRVKVTPEKIV